MTPWKVFILALVLLMHAKQSQGVYKVTVNAAMRYLGTYVVLIAGNDVVFLQNNVEVKVDKVSVFGFPTDFPVNSVYAPDEEGSYYAFGLSYFFTSNFTEDGKFHDYPESWKRRFGNIGPDAVAMRDDRVFFFKDCQLATYDESGVLKHRRSKKLGLPCQPDAAWSSDDGSAMVLLKGDLIWIWDYKRVIDGPRPFSSMYHMKSWELLSSDCEEDEDEDIQ